MRPVAALGVLAIAWAVAGVGCSSSPEGAVATGDPAAAFAPLVLIDRGERWLPMGADEFLRNSVLWWSDPERCSDRKIAVGRELAEQRNARVDWLFVYGLGSGPNYWRNPLDAGCDLDFDRRFYANQLTRPYERVGRDPTLRLTDGYFLDLEDSARGGTGVRAPVYFESRPEEVDGAAGLRLTYWLLFGMEERPDGRSREGDWERVDVLLETVDGGRYAPRFVRLGSDGRRRAIAWGRVDRVPGAEGGERTHPVLRSARGHHALSTRGCGDCRRWPAWRELADATRQDWYGFGGAWGEPGASSATTGPLGPHRRWPTREQVESGNG